MDRLAYEPSRWTAALRRAGSVSLLVVSSVTVHAANPPPELLARATGAVAAPVHLFLSDAPLETVLRLAAEAADLELELARPLPGTLSGTIEGTLGDVLRTVAERAPALYDIEADLLEVRPMSARTEARLPLGRYHRVVEHLVGDPLDQRLPGNTVQLDGAELLVAGHPAFVARTIVSARAALPPETETPESGTTETGSFEPMPDEPSAPGSLMRGDVPSLPPVEPAPQRHPLDALDEIPGFYTD